MSSVHHESDSDSKGKTTAASLNSSQDVVVAILEEARQELENAQVNGFSRYEEIEGDETGDQEDGEMGGKQDGGAEEHVLQQTSDETIPLDEAPLQQVDEEPFASPAGWRPSSADGSLSIPDDTPSIQDSPLSAPSRPRLQSPTPSLLPFDRRLQTRLSSSPNSPRALSPAFLNAHSRRSSVASHVQEIDTPDAPWEVVRWTRLRRISGQAFSEVGKRKFGRPTCISVAVSIAIGTSKGMILIFDYHQNLKTVIGGGTKAVESGAVTSIALSADHSTIAGGHANGSIFTWEIARPAKPFLHIPAVDRRLNENTDGHVLDVSVLHIGFLGARHTALVSADDRGMAFSHLATRGMGAIARAVKTTRILGRYPDLVPTRPKKPSSVLAFAPLPLGNVEHPTDSLGLVAMLTPYLLVIVSTTPIAQTQFKLSRPKSMAAHGAMSAALAWHPAMTADKGSSDAKLVYTWLDSLVILDVVIESDGGKDRPPDLSFQMRKQWKAEESIVAVQWLSRSVLAIITISQQLIILEDSLQVTDSSDLIPKHIYQADVFSQQLSQLVEKLDEEDTSMHGVVADAFYMSFKAYKGRLFLLGFNDISMGTLSNWADRLLAMMEHGDFIGAIQLATTYYTGENDRATVGLPENKEARHALVQEKLLEMMSASLRFVFGKSPAASTKVSPSQLEELANVCFTACLAIDELDFVFEDVFSGYSDQQVIYMRVLESYIADGEIQTVPPVVLKDLVSHFVSQGLDSRLEETICRLNPETFDIDQITGLCKKFHLYDALFYVWNEALNDYTTILGLLLEGDDESPVFPYLSFILTGRVYPTGQAMSDAKAIQAKAELYSFLFSSQEKQKAAFPNLRRILDIDAPNFLSVLNEAFEDSFLNDSELNGIQVNGAMSSEQRFGRSLNRQYILSILLEVMIPPVYATTDILYLDMFIARNLPKFSQFILLPGSILHRVLLELCDCPKDIADDCQLSVEYLLSVYQPPDIPSLLLVLSKAHFYRVIKSIYRNEKQYALLLQTCFEDSENADTIFECIALCFTSKLSKKQLDEVRNVILEHAKDMLAADLLQTARTLTRYAPDLHATMLQAMSSDEHSQYEYLREILEPTKSQNGEFVEQYVRLLCDYDKYHVTEYVRSLKAGDVRLEEVLPSLEEGGIIDAAVILMAREGQIKAALSRLIEYLQTLEAALLGLIDGAGNSPDVDNTQEAIDDLIASLQKYSRIGVWLCQRSKPSKRKSEELSTGEMMWLDLVDAVVQTTRSVGEAMAAEEPPFDAQRLLNSLRSVVQDAFTALLVATSSPDRAQSGSLSFLRILRAFLTRASLSSPSLAHLRQVLGAIFSAYSYEQSLLAIANRLLDKDVFVYVDEVVRLRKRGWRPLGMVCEGCGKRCWGPGVGKTVWDAWERANESAAGEGKGKQIEEVAERSEPLIIFSCRHVFHKSCLDTRMRIDRQEIQDRQGLDVGNGELGAEGDEGNGVAGQGETSGRQMDQGRAGMPSPAVEVEGRGYRCPLEDTF